jgi:alkanesulfonate monooxygenase SsuD/methylene tetrahydromethanopterin reductase-like flavin-dependent oxidoreductase (luciferase family)
MTFRSWFFTEMPYPDLPSDDQFDSMRVTLPSRVFDPVRGADLYERYFDLYRTADAAGLDVMVNEHHATATCVDSCAPLALAILARETKHARLLILGNPVSNREEPVRIAEEMAMCDVISRGRVEVGFVRGVPQEISPSNVNPVLMKERFWEAVDLIVHSWISLDGPFNWEGDHFHARQVNVWPRVHQQPHPPLWIPTQSAATVVEAADRGFNLAVILNGHDGARRMFDAYRQRRLGLGLAPAAPAQLAYLGLVFVGADDAEARAGARQLQWYLQNNKIAPQFLNPPGYQPAALRAPVLAATARGASLGTPIAEIVHASVDELIERGMMFAGTPDAVIAQISRFHERVGGFGNLLMMMHGGHMDHDTAARSIDLYAREVQPALRRALSS